MIDGTFNLVKYLGWQNGWPTHARAATFNVSGSTVRVTVERAEGRYETTTMTRREARAEWKNMVAHGWSRDYETEGELEMALGGAY